MMRHNSVSLGVIQHGESNGRYRDHLRARYRIDLEGRRVGGEILAQSVQYWSIYGRIGNATIRAETPRFGHRRRISQRSNHLQTFSHGWLSQTIQFQTPTTIIVQVSCWPWFIRVSQSWNIRNIFNNLGRGCRQGCTLQKLAQSVHCSSSYSV